MGLITKGKQLTGSKGKELIKEKEVKLEAKQELDKIVENTSGTKLTNKEIDFILAKLRQGNYTGAEFEIFYVVFKKLGDMKS